MSEYKHVTGIGKVQLTEDEIAQSKKISDDYKKIKYKHDRKLSYPNIGDQLDDLFRQGAFSEEMTAKLQQVKTDHPKPE